MTDVKIGSKAPQFTLTDREGKAHQLYDKGSEYTVVYFYPKDDTPGCTVEAQEFNGTLKDFGARKARVVGVSGGDDKSKAKFCKKFGLDVTLLSDPDFRVAAAYGSYGEKKFMGRAYNGIFRKTFVVDKTGKIAHIFEGVKPEGHANQVLEVIDALRSGRTVEAEKQPRTVAKAGAKAAPKRAPSGKVAARKESGKKSTVKGGSAARAKPKGGKAARK